VNAAPAALRSRLGTRYGAIQLADSIARLGIQQAGTVRGNGPAVLRAIQASKLRSRLTTRATNSRDTGKLIAVRRTLRRRQGQPRSLKPRP
jgi:hypothetical protein